jgi:hypothetical protein
MKYRIIKEDNVIKVQERGWLTLFRWVTCARFGGSFGNEDFEFETIEEAEQTIDYWRGGKSFEVLKVL